MFIDHGSNNNNNNNKFIINKLQSMFINYEL